MFVLVTFLRSFVFVRVSILPRSQGFLAGHHNPSTPFHCTSVLFTLLCSCICASHEHEPTSTCLCQPASPVIAHPRVLCQEQVPSSDWLVNNYGPTLNGRGRDCRTHETFPPPQNPFPDLPWLNKQHGAIPLPGRPYDLHPDPAPTNPVP